ncbi:MAG: alkaline shock response membrane anchor protein AmaP [Clostridia bacterium]|nr:alkaline shock response membrane anchor protein AmaP [Clostridia bacterium]
MKLTAGKRVLMFFHWLLSLLTCAAFAFYIIKPELIKGLFDSTLGRLGSTKAAVIGIAALAIYTLLSALLGYVIFHRGKREERDFITVDASDTGRVRIAVSAIEQMVRQSVNSIDGISDMKISIENADDAIIINIVATIVNGSHVPTITMNMQRAIRQFVEMNCGVAVRSVSISINSVANAEEPQKRLLRRRDRASQKRHVDAQPVGVQAATVAPEEDIPAAPYAPDTDEAYVYDRSADEPEEQGDPGDQTTDAADASEDAGFGGVEETPEAFAATDTNGQDAGTFDIDRILSDGPQPIRLTLERTPDIETDESVEASGNDAGTPIEPGDEAEGLIETANAFSSGDDDILGEDPFEKEA